jgi:hypothetical protein
LSWWAYGFFDLTLAVYADACSFLAVVSRSPLVRVLDSMLRMRLAVLVDTEVDARGARSG